MSVINCINPATLEEFATIEATPPEKVSGLVQRGREAQTAWGVLSFRKRAHYLLKARGYLLDNIDSFAKAITVNNGKPLIESLTAEIHPIADLITYFAHHTEKLLRGHRIPIGIWTLLGRTSHIVYQPTGTVGIISPWNYPFSIPVGTAVMALMAGNTVLLKPSSVTAYVGQKIEEMFTAAGFPQDVFIHLPGRSETAKALLQSEVDKIFFTGSTEVGKEVMSSCSKNVIPCNLELGGKDPLIILDDVDLDHATHAAVWGAFTNAGQCCASIERVYVHKKIESRFIEKVVAQVSLLKVGSGLEPATDMGPLTTAAQLKTVEEQVAEAKSRGAQILTGGERIKDLKGYFYKPTILTGIDHTFQCVREETFGPLMPIMTFESDEEAVALANDTPYGLNACVFGKNKRRTERIARELRCGTVAINECVYTHGIPSLPWGGIKKSGYGRTHGESGLKEMVRLHHIHTNNWTFLKDVWWFPYGEKYYGSFRKLARFLTGGIFSKLRALPTFFKLLLMKGR